MKKILPICVTLILVAACQSPYTDPTYNHQTKKFNTPYTFWKKTRESAEKTAIKELDSYAKDQCRSMSMGWYLKKIEDKGTLSCEEGDEGFQCKHKDVSVLCEQLDESSRQ